jgi:PUA domain protein
MPERYRRYFLKTKQTKDLLNEASRMAKADLGQVFKKEAEVEVVETDFVKIILLNRRPMLALVGKRIYPTLTSKEFFLMLPKVVVDMGAIPYVCKGADVMAPGIRSFDGEFEKSDLVFIVDEKYGKPVALGEIAYDSEEVKKVKRGPVVKNIFFVGDRTWNFLKQLTTVIKRNSD